MALMLVLSSVFTSMITASLEAGGGLLLLLLMALWLPPAALVPVHGMIQLGSNGGRVLLTWRSIDWRLIAAFAPGVLVGALLAAALTSFASMFVGATGPLVAAFVKQVHSDRFATVATFATAMTLQHVPKALVFGFAGFVFLDWLAFIAAMVLAGLAGTWIGIRLLRQITDRRCGSGPQ